jgi:formylglycine-generating enzyme
MNASRTRISVCVMAVGLLTVTAAAVNIETVPVGNPGNAGDTEIMEFDGTTGYGSVGYSYNIGKYEVTAGQYTEFLNAVAKTDTYGLYNADMWSNAYGCKIQRSGTSGNFTYSVAPDRANRPVNYVSYWDSCRFANWLHNDQPTGAQGAGTTETGGYPLNGYNGGDGGTIQRNAGWKWAVTSEDEWYKAAYHKNDGATGNYWDYPTSSNSVPSNVLGYPADPGNNATYYDYYGTGTGGFTIGTPYWRTEAGAHENSDSPYGTFDQGGNVEEWNEAIGWQDATYAYRCLRGAAYDSYYLVELRASGRSSNDPRIEDRDVGFRVAYVPEPATLLLLAVGGLAVTRRRR